ncbi:MAG: preprotein translocase subunit SecG [Alphaproteobacteria bacterium]|jgi:preprotein translocase subunit SecG|nr:preprotein translocase subunit SecG [Candidatus Jidaibacter sp.]
MTTILLIIQALIVFALITVVLIQRSSSDSLAGLSSSGHNVFSSKATSTILTKITIGLAIAFTVNCIIVAKVINSEHKGNVSIVDSIVTEEAAKPIEAPQATE